MFKRQKQDQPLKSGSESATAELPSPMPVPGRPLRSVVGQGAGALPTPLRSPGDPLPARSALSETLPPLPTGLPPRNALPLPSPVPVPRPGRAQQRTLVVGHGICVQGTVQDAERLVVEGTVEASIVQATELSVAPDGTFRGGAEVEEAEIAGTIDGKLTVRGNLVVRASGKVFGSVRCRRLQVEEGGQINGQVEMLPDAVRSEGSRVLAEAVG